MSLNLNNWGVFWINQEQMVPNVVGRWRGGGKLRVLHEAFLIPIILYGSQAMVLREKERSKIRNMQMNNLKKYAGY